MFRFDVLGYYPCHFLLDLVGAALSFTRSVLFGEAFLTTRMAIFPSMK